MGTQTAALTPEDLLTLPPPKDGKGYELSKGELIVVPYAKWPHEEAKARISELLILHVAPQRLGRIYVESGFRLTNNLLRVPDVAFVSRETLAAHPLADKLIPFAPDLAIEVISDSESAADAEDKVHEYLEAGVQEVWQVYPRWRGVRVHTAAGPRDVGPDEILESAVLPGLRVAVRELFPEPAA